MKLFIIGVLFHFFIPNIASAKSPNSQAANVPVLSISCADLDHNGGSIFASYGSVVQRFVADGSSGYSGECKVYNSGSQRMYLNFEVTSVHDPDIHVYYSECQSYLEVGESCRTGIWFHAFVLGFHLVKFKITDIYSGTTWSYELSGNVVKPPPPKIKAGVCEVQSPGSIINVDSLTLGEKVNIQGTDVELVYSTKYSDQYLVPENKIGRFNSLNPEGWSVSLVHFFDAVNGKLYLGTGSVVSKESAPYGSQLMVVENNEVYIFESNGRHIETRSILTGVVKYSFSYDSAGKLIKITDTFGNETVFGRTPSGQLSYIDSPYGQRSTIFLNSDGLISQIKSPAMDSHYISYKVGTSLISSFTTPSRRIAKMEYDADGRLLSDKGDAHGWTFDAYGINQTDDLKIEKKSSMNNIWTYQINRDGGATTRKEIAPWGEESVTYQSDLGDSQMTSSELSTSASFRQDERFGSLLRVPWIFSQKIGNKTGYTTITESVSGLGNTPFDYVSLTRQVSDRGVNVSETYNSATKTFEEQIAGGRLTRRKLDQYERVIETQLGGDTPINFYYDYRGRIETVQQGVRQLSKYFYNSYGLPYKIKDAKGSETLYTYTDANLVQSILFPNGNSVSFAYDDDGNLTGVTPPGRLLHKLNFGKNGLLSSYSPPIELGSPSLNVTYLYNSDGQISNIRTPDKAELQFSYLDGLLASIKFGGFNQRYIYKERSSLLKEVTSFDSVKTSFEYVGPLVSKISTYDMLDSNALAEIRYSYDNYFRINKKTLSADFLANPLVIENTYRIDGQIDRIGNLYYEYENLSARLKKTRIYNVEDERTYNSFGELSGYTSSYNGAPIFSYSLSRDELGRIIQKTETLMGQSNSFQYGYDSAGRLHEVKKNGKLIGLFEYDLNGNLESGIKNQISIVASYNMLDQLTTFQGTTYGYNKSGELTEVERIPQLPHKFLYDPLGRLTSATLGNIKVDYRLDYNGNRYSKFLNGYKAKRAVYDSEDNLIAEFDENLRSSRVFVHGVVGGAPEYMLTEGKVFRVLKDHLGSPRVVINVLSGEVVQVIEFDVWGKEIKNTNRGLHPFGFAGGLTDGHTGFIKFGARNYDPEVGRWTSKDPILFAGGDVNLYGYVENDPVNWVDPDGLTKSKPGQVLENDPFAGGGGGPSGSIGGSLGGSSGGSCPITGYTRHGINSAISRADGGSMSPKVILNTVTNPTSIAPNTGGGVIYSGPGGQVILNSSGQVITVIPSGSSSFRGNGVTP